MQMRSWEFRMWGGTRSNWAKVGGMMMVVGLCVSSLGACSSPPPQSAQLPDGSATATSKSPAVPEVASKPAETTPPPIPAGWPTADLVVAANLDGEGPDELVIWGPSGLTLWAQGESQPYPMTLAPDTTEEKLEGAPNIVIVQDLDKDGRDDVLLGYGMTRGALNPPITLASLRLKGESGKHKRTVDILYRVNSERPQVTGLSVADVLGDARPEILLSWFDSKYFVTTMAFFLRSDGDPLSPPPGNAKASPYLTGIPYARVRMATSWAFGTLGPKATTTKVKNKASMVLGRPYGEEKLSPGDIFVLTGAPGKMETKELIPAQLGVRSVTIGDGDGDGTSEVYFGDGWHYEYGTKARGRLSVSSLDPSQKGPGRWLTRLIEDTQGQYEIGQIVIEDVDGDQKPEILAAGDKFISLYWFEDGWKVRKIADGSAFSVTRTSKGKAVAIAGKPLRLVPIGGRTDGAPVSKTVSQPGTVR